MTELVGVIPAAGLSTRMANVATPKALVEVAGRPLIETAIDSLRSLNVSKIVVVIGHRGEQVREYLSSRQSALHIEFVHQEKQLGLPHAIATAAPLIDSDFVVLCPDNIFSDASDLIAAKETFVRNRPPFLMVATVTPTRQRDRAKYFSAAMPKIAPLVYRYRVGDASDTRGLAMNSTGCTFFRADALKSLPSFANIESEVSLHTYLTQLTALGNALIYLLRGMRYDFSGLDDVRSYASLQDELRETVGAGVSTILIDAKGRVLMQHRDDKPAIRYPNHWALFGGSIEDGESAYAAARREIFEEIGYNVENLGLFREFVQNRKREYAFVGEVDASLDELTLSEGQGMDFVEPDDLPKLLIRPDDKETLKAYFGDWNE